MPTHRPMIIPADTYTDEVITIIDNAQRRIVLCAMVVRRDGPCTSAIFDALTRASNRGVNTSVIADAYSLSRFFGASAAVRAATSRSFADLRSRGASVHIIGRVGLPNPYAGRMHAKFVVGDDTSLVGGGINIEDSAFMRTDFMLRYTDASVANILCDIATQLTDVNRADTPDPSYDLSTHSTLLFDRGAPGRSLIYNKVLELVAESRRVTYVSQLMPGPAVARALTARGRTLRLYTNRPTQKLLLAGMSILVDSLRYRLHNSYRKSAEIHAKYIICELADGQLAMISGSHNFAGRGVTYGTAEIAIVSHDQTACRQLLEYTRINVAQ